jgi:hypothetical protein
MKQKNGTLDDCFALSRKMEKLPRCIVPNIRFTYHVDKDEKVNRYINGVLLDKNQEFFKTEENFRLKIEQYRVHAEKNSVIKDIFFFLIMPIYKCDRFENAKERERPFYAYYESECESFVDSEIIITQYKKGFHSTFDVSSPSAVFRNVVNEERINKRTYRNWVISSVFFLALVSSIPLFMLGRIIFEALTYHNLPILLVGFMVVFCSVFLGVTWYKVFSAISPKTIDKYDTCGKENEAARFYRIASFFWVLLGLLSYFLYLNFPNFSSAIPCVGGGGAFLLF